MRAKEQLKVVREIVENVTHRNKSDVNSMTAEEAIQALDEFFRHIGEQ